MIEKAKKVIIPQDLPQQINRLIDSEVERLRATAQNPIVDRQKIYEGCYGYYQVHGKLPMISIVPDPPPWRR